MNPIFIAAVGFEAGLALLAVLAGTWLDAPPLQWLRWSPVDAAWGAAAALPLALPVVAALRAGAPFATRLLRAIDAVLEPLLALPVWQLLVIAAAAGLFEELLFRGLVQAVVQGWAGPWWGLAAGSLLFGLAHPVSRSYVAVATLFGLWLGWTWLASGNLLVPVVAHAVYDGVLLLYLRGSRVVSSAARPAGSD